MIDTGIGNCAEKRREGLKGGDFNESLDFVQGVAMRRVAKAQSVVGEGVVFVSVGCKVDIAI